MDDWRVEDKRQVSRGELGQFTISVSYLKGIGQTDVLASTPCLKGSPLTKPSMFPQPGSVEPQ